MASVRPRHEHVSQWLRERIESGTLAEDDQLPSENQLGSRFGVSRITVRRALQTLEADGLIYRKQGMGSFVKDNRIHQGLVRLTDFVEDMEAAGLIPQSIILHQGMEPAGVRVAEALGVAEGALVYRVDRLRKGDGDPMAFDRTWLPPFYGHLIEKHDLRTSSIYSILEDNYDICVCRGRFRIEAVNAPNDVAQHLDVPWGRALLLIERTSFTEADQRFYYQQRFYRSDRVAYELELFRGSSRNQRSGLPLKEFEPIFKKDGDPPRGAAQ
ncbi:MAG: GntR family transcriptional regulator [Bacteroidetes bacterium]|nr:GntR family transcriptional regulator [Bacteroidota bacterium]